MDTPDLDQIGRIASVIKRRRWPDGPMPCGITHEDLIAEGWLAYIKAKRFGYARAKYAMIDYLRRMMAPVSGRMSELRGCTGVDLHEDIVDERSEQFVAPVRQRRLRRGDINALRAFCYRTLSERKARIAIEVLIAGESVEVMADRLEISRERAVVIRSQAFGEIRNATS